LSQLPCKPLSGGKTSRSPSAINFAHVDAADDDHDIGDSVTEAHVFEDGEVDEAWRSHAVTIGVPDPSLIK